MTTCPICPICCEDIVVDDDTVSLPCDPIVPHVYHKKCVLINIRFLYDKDVNNTDFKCAMCRKNYQYMELTGHEVTFDQVFNAYKYWSLYIAILIFVFPMSMIIHGYVFYDLISIGTNTIIVLNVAFSVMMHMIYFCVICQCITIRHQVHTKKYNLMACYEAPDHIKSVLTMIAFFFPPVVLLGLYLAFPGIYTLSGSILITLFLWMCLPFCTIGQSKILDNWLNDLMQQTAKQIRFDLLPVFVLNVLNVSNTYDHTNNNIVQESTV